MGIKNWWTQFKEFEKFLPLLTWDHRNKREQKPVPWNKENIWKLFLNVLDNQLLQRLQTEEWDIPKKPWVKLETKSKIWNQICDEKSRVERISRIKQKMGSVCQIKITAAKTIKTTNLVRKFKNAALIAAVFTRENAKIRSSVYQISTKCKMNIWMKWVLTFQQSSKSSKKRSGRNNAAKIT